MASLVGMCLVLCACTQGTGATGAAGANRGTWTTRGFEAFRRGTFGNAGQNLYVSRAGVLQRIHQFDFNRDGYVEAVFANAQGYTEVPPVYVYADPSNTRDKLALDAEGARTGAVADFNADGFDDLVVGNNSNGITSDLNTFVYFGSPGGLTERYRLQLPAPSCYSLAAGDFNGDGRPDLAAVTRGVLRVFYQSEFGLEAQRFQDLEGVGGEIAADDLDADGFCDLYVLAGGKAPEVLWGASDGIAGERRSQLPVADASKVGVLVDREKLTKGERRSTTVPLARVMALDGAAHLFVPFKREAWLVPVTTERDFGPTRVFDCEAATSVDVGDVNGDGESDLVFAARDRSDGEPSSLVYLGDGGRFDEERRVRLATPRACDVALGDLDGDGCDDVVIAQNQSDTSYSFHSLVFRGNRETAIEADPIRLPTEGALRTFIVRTSTSAQPQVAFINQKGGGILGEEPTTIYWGGADGFSPDRRRELPGIGPVRALGCDVNDDAYTDLIIANGAEDATERDPGTFCFLGGPDGYADTPDVVLPTRHAWGLAAGDLNRDGFLDVVVSAYAESGLVIFYGDSNGFDTEHAEEMHVEFEGKRWDRIYRVWLADMNNDGWLDMIVPQILADHCFLLWGGPEGFDPERRQVLSVVNGSAAQAVDLTGNGYLDLVIGGHKPNATGPRNCFLYIYWNGPEGLREDRRQQLPADAVITVAPADFNNDGVLDIFIGSYTDGRRRDIDSYLYWGRPGGTFSETDFAPIRTHSCAGSLAADVNEDGWVDLVVANHKTFGDHIGDSSVYLNGPDGFSSRPSVRLPTRGVHGMMPVQPGNIRDRGPEEYYVSEPIRLPEGARVRRIEWRAEMPVKTWVRARLRAATSREGLEAAPWRGPAGEDRWFESGDSVAAVGELGPWVQYELALGAINSGNTPRVSEVSLSYEW